MSNLCFIFTMVQEILGGKFTWTSSAAGSNGDHVSQEDYEDCDDCNDNEEKQSGKLL